MVLGFEEQALLWYGVLAGTLGTLGVIWQIFVYFRGERKASLEVLNSKVLHPWSHIKARKSTNPEEVLSIDLVIPNRALPGDMKATATRDLHVYELRGFSWGKRWLRREKPDVWKKWQDVLTSEFDYEDARFARKYAISTLVSIAMKKAFPTFRPAYPQRSVPGRYLKTNIVAKVESEASRRVEGVTRMDISLASVIFGDVARYELRNGGTLLIASDEQEADRDALTRVVESCAKDEAVVGLSNRMIKSEQDLKAALKEFCDSLREATFNIEMGELGS